MNFVMKKGEYYVGDLCYVMHEVWEEVCEKMFKNNSGESGKYKLDNGVEFCVFTTMYGDGAYQDQKGRSYDVDAGVIGCILVDDIKKTEENYMTGGNIITFHNDFNCFSKDGKITFGSVVIDTGDECEEEDYYLDHSSSYDDEED